MGTKTLLGGTTPHRLRMSAAVESKLRAHHLAPGKNVETISLALGHAWLQPDGAVTINLADPEVSFLLGDDCHSAKQVAYASVPEDIRAAIYWRAVREGYTAVVDVHDHHFAKSAHFSGVDNADDRSTATYFSTTLQSFVPVGAPPVYAAALLLAQDDWAARIVYAGQVNEVMQPMKVESIGLHWKKLDAKPAERGIQSAALHARHAGVIPAATQAAMKHMHAVLVGCGGTGSIMAEVLLRMGIGKITLIDADRVEESNLNRFQGGTPHNIGELKVECLRERLMAMWPEACINAIEGQVHDKGVAALARQADLLIGCVDNAETRWWLNRLAIQYMLPYFDCGVLIETQPVNLSTRVSVVIPGAGPCGHCSPIEFFERSHPPAFMDATTIQAQRQAGYLLEEPQVQCDPSIYPLNLNAVSQLGQQLLAWLTGYQDICHSFFQTGDLPAQRLALSRFGETMAEDCPVCAYLLGKSHTVDLPEQDVSNILISDFQPA